MINSILDKKVNLIMKYNYISFIFIYYFKLLKIYLLLFLNSIPIISDQYLVNHFMYQLTFDKGYTK